jgi:Tfp pilus assembly protein PilV
MSRRNRKNRGFAMLMALAALGLVSVTLLVLSRQFAYDMTRTQTVTREAQLSQLLLAGAQDAAQRSRSWSAHAQKEQWQIELPRELSPAAKLSVELSSAGDEKADVVIEAKVDAQAAVQTLHFRHADGNWGVESVERGFTSPPR